MKSEISDVISFLRFPLAVMVVFIHSSGYGECDIQGINVVSLGGNNIYDILRVLVSETICLVAVPAFFLISGYLFYQKLQIWDWSIWKDKVHKRIYTLLIPYILWSIARWTFNLITANAISLRHGGTWDDVLQWIYTNTSFMMFWHDKLTDIHYINWLGGVYANSAPIHTPFWFIRDLIIMVTISPLIACFFRNRTVATIYMFMLFVAFISMIWPVMPGLSIKAVFFFSLGGFFAYGYGITVHWYINKPCINAVIYFILTIMMVCSYQNWELRSILYPWFVLSAMFVLYVVVLNLIRRGYSFPLLLKDSCFFIFASHMFFLISKGLFMDFFDIPKPETPLSLMLWYFIDPTIAVGCSVFCFCVLKRFMPRTCYLLTGYKQK